MLPLREIPMQLKLFCKECKEIRIHEFSGFARFGYMYRCKFCGRIQILTEQEVVIYKSLQEHM